MFTRYARSLLKSALFVTLIGFAHAPLVFAQCGGQISLSTDTLEWNGSQIGMPSQQTIVITNTGVDQLCLFNVTSTCPALLASFNPIPIPPLGTSTITVDFVPQLDRWYSATIEIFTSDPSSPRDSVTVFARSCQTALAPGMPILMPPMSSYMVYWAIPWDENKEGVEYALQVRKMPENEIYYCTIDGGLDFDYNWHTDLEWARNGIGAVGGLEPGGNYELTLLTRDCMGNMSVGVSAFIFMPQEIDEAPIEDFTVHATTAGGPVELRWDPAVTDIFGTPLPFDGYLVLEGSHPDSIDNYYASCSGNFNALPVEDGLKLFTVYPNTNGTYWGTNPFFTWPPDNAPLFGLNTVSLRDPANWSEWSSVLIQVDSMGWVVTLDSLGHEDLQRTGNITLTVDFDKYGLGPHTISAVVTDLHNVVTTAWKTVNVVERPRADFIASYAPGPRLFNLTATNVFTPAPYIDLWWPTSTVDERYGPSIQFESKEGEETLHVIKPIPILASKILNEELPWPLDIDSTYGVVVDVNAPGNFQVVGKDKKIFPCCVDVGANETEKDTFKVECVKVKQESVCKISGNFQFTINWSWTLTQSTTSWSVSTRSTSSSVDGTCIAGPNGTTIFRAGKGNFATKTKAYKQKNEVHPPEPGFPFNGGTEDELASMTDKKRKPAILPHKTKYDTETIDVPNTTENAVTKSGADAKTMSTRLVGNFYFSLVALDACGAACVKEKYVQYDVYCCRREGTDCITYTVIRPDLRDGPPLVNPNP